MNEGKRQQKYAKMLQKELSFIFHKHRNLVNDQFVTISAVKVSPDLGIARVYLSMLLIEDNTTLLEKINSRKGEIRGLLGRRIHNQVRIIPDIFFYHDEVEESAARLDKIIDDLDIPPLDDDENPSS